MTEDLYRVELTESFLHRLDAIEAFLVEADAAFAFDKLLDELRTTVIPNLARFPRIGRRYLGVCAAEGDGVADGKGGWGVYVG